MSNNVSLPQGHPLKPIEGLVHEEIRDIDRIAKSNDGIAVEVAYREHGMDEVHVSWDAFESGFLPSMLLEEINKPNREIVYVRVYSETGTITLDELLPQLEGRTIPDNMLANRNANSEYYGTIDKYGRRTSEPTRF